MTDLRSFLDRVREERRSDLLEVEREVNPRHETTAILTKLEGKQRSPILFFRKVAGSRFPLVSNVCGSMGRLALALDCPLKMVAERYAEACKHLIPPTVTKNAPVQQNVLRGAEVVGLRFNNDSRPALFQGWCFTLACHEEKFARRPMGAPKHEAHGRFAVFAQTCARAFLFDSRGDAPDAVRIGYAHRNRS